MAMKDWNIIMVHSWSTMWKSEKTGEVVEVQKNMRGHWSVWVDNKQIGKTTPKLKAFNKAKKYMKKNN